MKRRYFIIDVERCLGCFNCLHACKDEHVGNSWLPVTLPQKLHQQYWITTKERVRGQHPMIDVAYLTEPCNHCEHAPCVEKGRGAAYRREDGVVLIDPEKAGRESNLEALCPYGKISWNEEAGVYQKCTFCAHLLDQGWQQPRCAQSCPIGALRMYTLEPEEMDAMAAAEGLELAHPEHRKTGPSVFYKNLYRWNRCFIGGTVVSGAGAQESCLENCTVSLKKDGKLLDTRRTDAYGDFRFDRLEPGSGTYEVEAAAEGFRSAAVKAELGESVYLGLIRMEKERI